MWAISLSDKMRVGGHHLQNALRKVKIVIGKIRLPVPENAGQTIWTHFLRIGRS